MDIIIDGYNLLNASPHYQARGGDWEQARQRLMKQLQQYQSVKQHKITVVFDGWKHGWPTEQRERQGNIQVIFSRQGEQADEVIKRMVRQGKRSPLVVTSDREIIQVVEQAGAQVVRSAEFEGKLQMAAYLGAKGGEECYDESLDKPLSTRKKGNPRRLPRKERQRRLRVEKL